MHRLFANAADARELFDSSEGALSRAVLDNAGGQRRSDARQRTEVVRACRVDVQRHAEGEELLAGKGRDPKRAVFSRQEADVGARPDPGGVPAAPGHTQMASEIRGVGLGAGGTVDAVPQARSAHGNGVPARCHSVPLLGRGRQPGPGGAHHGQKDDDSGATVHDG